jgi:ethanolamine utilization protein EutQ (cupin superfamily)
LQSTAYDKIDTTHPFYFAGDYQPLIALANHKVRTRDETREASDELQLFMPKVSSIKFRLANHYPVETNYSLFPKQA